MHIFSPNSNEMTCSLEKAILWKQWFQVKNILMTDLFPSNMQLFTLQDINWSDGVMWITYGLVWCFYQLVRLSFWRHPFTAEDPLVSKWCNSNFSKSVPMKKQSHLHLGRPDGEYIFVLLTSMKPFHCIKDYFQWKKII